MSIFDLLRYVIVVDDARKSARVFWGTRVAADPRVDPSPKFFFCYESEEVFVWGVTLLLVSVCILRGNRDSLQGALGCANGMFILQRHLQYDGISNFSLWSEGAKLDIFDIIDEGIRERLLDPLFSRPESP